MKKILIIDDDEIILKSYCYMLQNLGFEVTTTNEAEKGLELSIKKEYDLILTDFNMPHMNGLELIRLIKESNKNTNIYISSGGMVDSEMQEVMNSGASGILEKPLRISDLASLID